MTRIRENHSRAAAAALLLFTLAAAGRAADATLLKGELDGKELSAAIAKQKGHVVLVNFWATWCVPCREEFPDFVRLEKAYRDRGLRVIGVSTDLAKDLPKVEKFLAAAPPDFPNYRKKSGGDDQDFIESVDAKWGGELPFTVLYGKDGKKTRVLSGKQSYAELEKAIAPLLK
ncbi:MAG TPA: TlpA disulfide reductase family protein [Thermoanaerobaculia bacterium]|jgi:thiol-disulfide isomerase/thioredoxin|nr:TlpA disulfide reductase family protein [Thermoanaerobaculia bacterium]